MKMKTQPSNIYETQQKQSKKEVIAIQAFLKEQEKSHINNITYHLKELEKEKNKAQSQQKEGNNKDQDQSEKRDQNKNKNQKQQRRPMKPRAGFLKT